MEKGLLEERNEKIDGKSGTEKERIMDKGSENFSVNFLVTLSLSSFVITFTIFIRIDLFFQFQAIFFWWFFFANTNIFLRSFFQIFKSKGRLKIKLRLSNVEAHWGVLSKVSFIQLQLKRWY